MIDVFSAIVGGVVAVVLGIIANILTPAPLRVWNAYFERRASRASQRRSAIEKRARELCQDQTELLLTSQDAWHFLGFGMGSLAAGTTLLLWSISRFGPTSLANFIPLFICGLCLMALAFACLNLSSDLLDATQRARSLRRSGPPPNGKGGPSLDPNKPLGD